jgi:predicted helicase
LFHNPPSYLFIPQDRNRAEEYERGWLITEMMPVNSVGLYTARDNLAIQWTKAELQAILKDFISLPEEMARQKYNLGPDSRDWKVDLAQKDVQASKLNEAKIQQITYRPFDMRYTYYTGISRGFICMPRPEVMHNLIDGRNWAICFMRNSREQIVSNFLVANHIVDKTILSSADNANVAPLYIYLDALPQNTLFPISDSSTTSVARTPNLSPAFITDISNKLHMTFIPYSKGDLQHTFGPEDMFNYMYAVFHSLTYRERYAEFLKIDFPRLPLTSNVDLFRELCMLGNRLVGLHLLQTSGQITTSYPEPGNNVVEKVEYTQSSDDPEQGRVWINKTQYFAGVPPQVWNFYVGGYQVCQKWLKDRKGRALSYDDSKHYQKIVAALAETIVLMEQVDEQIEEHGEWPIV